MAFVTRATGVFPVIAALAAAAALTGVAVFTVDRAGCPDPGHFERIGGQTRLVGGCLRPDELPALAPPPAETLRDQHITGPRQASP